MSMSKKDYVAIAAILKCKIENASAADEPTKLYRNGVISTAFDLAGYFAASNDKFDRARFLKACGV